MAGTTREDRQRPLTASTELLVHGVGNTPPEAMLREAPVLVAGDGTTAFYRGEDPHGRVEAYSWGGLTSRVRTRALWLLVLPFALINAAGWMEPAGPERDEPEDGPEPPLSETHQWLTRFLALWATIATVVFLASITVDIVMLQCARQEACAEPKWWLSWATHPFFAGDEARLLVAGLAVPVSILALLVVAGWWSRSLTEERFTDYSSPSENAAKSPRRPLLGRLGMWGGVEMHRGLGWLHLGAALAALALVTELAFHAVAPAGHRLVLVGAAEALLIICALRATFGTGVAQKWAELRQRDTAERRKPITSVTTWLGRIPNAGWVVASVVVLVLAALDGLRYRPGLGHTPQRPAPEIAADPAVGVDAWQTLRDMFSNESFLLGLFPILAGLLALANVGIGLSRGSRQVPRALGGALMLSVVALLGIGRWLPGSGLLEASWLALVGLALLTPLTSLVLIVKHGREGRRRGPASGAAAAAAVGAGLSVIVAVLSGLAVWLANWVAGGGVDVVVRGLGGREVDPGAINLWWNYELVAFGLILVLLTYLAWVLARSAKHLWRRSARLKALYDDEFWHIAGSCRAVDTDRPLRSWLKRIDRMRRLQETWVRRMMWPAAMGVLVAVVYLVASSSVGRVGKPLFVAESGRWRWIVAHSLDLLPFVAIGFGYLVWRSFRSQELRRGMGIAWDLLTFWPRWFHPFGPPSYATRAVPELKLRMTSRLTGQVVLSGHSQGSVLAVATAAGLPDETLDRVFLLTHGSPLRSLYSWFFPRYFGRSQLAKVARLLDDDHAGSPRWRNIYRLTDPIGGPLAGSDETGDVLSRLDRKLQDPFPIRPNPGDPLPAPAGHSGYNFAAPYLQLVNSIHAFMLTGGRAPVAEPDWDALQSPGAAAPD